MTMRVAINLVHIGNDVDTHPGKVTVLHDRRARARLRLAVTRDWAHDEGIDCQLRPRPQSQPIRDHFDPARILHRHVNVQVGQADIGAHARTGLKANTRGRAGGTVVTQRVEATTTPTVERP